ncbi:MAG: acyl-CoA dehydrogenase family protein [Chloroflexi bacterium]|nr:acyl-CoA dehydrogenase family protein [Chloroflexota bacterium]
MEFTFTSEEKAFRQEVRQFLEKELPSDWNGFTEAEEGSRQAHAMGRAFTKKAARRGWVAMAWPKEYGGLSASHIQQAIYGEELAYARAPSDVPSHMAVTWVGPSLILYGTEEQKREFLPRICSGDIGFCTFYSEPGAGSDLAAMQTRAMEDGDDFVVNGQKIWTTGAHNADFGWLAARTDPNAPKHKGLSMFLVDLKTPGLEIRPLINMAGTHEFNEDFFTEVRVPKKNLVGELNRGWYLLAVALDFERSGVSSFASARRSIEELVEYARERKAGGRSLAADPTVRHKLADLKVAVETGRLLAYKVAWMQGRGLVPNREASQSKLIGSELSQRIANVGMQLLGLYGQVGRGDRHAGLLGRVQRSYMATVPATIGAGTSEIQRNIIAQRGLGLPR